MKNKKGFTLIELLVVIAIIGLLSTLAVVALNNARAKSRDARRVSDIKQVQTALELYLNDRSAYPTNGALVAGNCTVAGFVSIGGACINSGGAALVTTCPAGNTYMASAPTDPLTTAAYCYRYDSATSYSLRYVLEGETAGLAAGLNTATPAGIADN